MSAIPNGNALTAMADRTKAGAAPSFRAMADDTGEARKAVVDLVIAVGTDASMLAVAQSLESALDASIDAAGKACTLSLRVTSLGVGAYFGTTRFNTSVSDYLAVYVEDPADLQETPAPPGDLARAVIDLSRYFDWLPNAYRAIFLAGDIGLETISDQAAKTSDAIAAAKAAHVKVYTCVNMQANTDMADAAVSTLQGKDIAEYMRLATRTFGTGYVCTDSARDFPWMLQDVICDIASSDNPGNNGQGEGCDDDDGDGGERHGACCRCCRCEQARLIVRTANMLSTVLRRVTDSCYPPAKENR